MLFKVKWLVSPCRLLGWPLDYVPAAACLMRAPDAENTYVSSQQNLCGDEKQATEVGQQTIQKKWSKFLHLPEYHKTRSLASLRHFTPMKEITLVRCSSHSKSSDEDRFTAKVFLDGILIRKPRQDEVLVSIISIFHLYVESDGMCSLWETKNIQRNALQSLIARRLSLWDNAGFFSLPIPVLSFRFCVPQVSNDKAR